MAAWPSVADVKLALGVTTNAKDAVITVALGAAIEQVGIDLGYREVSLPDPEVPVLTGWLEEDEDDVPIILTLTPSHSLSYAALILAVMAVKAPDAPYGVAAVFDMGGLKVAADHPTYQRLLTGQRQAFGVA